MTKNDLAREVSVSEKLHLSTAVKAVDGIIRVIKEALAKGEEVTLRGFGTLSLRGSARGAQRGSLQDQRADCRSCTPHRENQNQ